MSKAVRKPFIYKICRLGDEFDMEFKRMKLRVPM